MEIIHHGNAQHNNYVPGEICCHTTQHPDADDVSVLTRDPLLADKVTLDPDTLYFHEAMK